MLKHNFVFPDFQNSIVNLAATMSKFLGNLPKHPTLPKMSEKLDNKVKNIVYLVIDGMGDRILANHLPADSFLRRHQIQTVTSVFPTTTAAATTSLISGLTSSEHGWFAWALDFDGEVVELFRNRNFYTGEHLPDPNFVRKKMAYPCFWDFPDIKREVYTCFPRDCYKNSAPHELTYKSLRQLSRILHKTCSQPHQKFIYAYFPDLDTLMHKHGTGVRKVHNFIKTLDRKIAKLVKKTPDTIFVITADHGQTDIQGFAPIYADQTLQDCLEHAMSWDARATSFKIKPNHDAKFRQAFQKYADDFALFTTEEIIKQGILGDFKQRPDLKKYVGDYITVGTETGKLFLLKDPQGKRLKKGTHSGMTPAEMYVPVIVTQKE